MKKITTVLKKRMLLVIFTGVLFLGFHTNVLAVKNLYECEYGDSKTKISFTIKGDQNLSATAKVTKYDGKTANKNATLKNWASFNQEKTNIPANLWVPKKGCPKYLTVQKVSTSGLSGESGGTYNVWANWDKTKADGHCKDKKNCKVTTRNGNPKPKLEVCYYNNNNEKSSSSNSMLMIYKEASGVGINVYVRRTVPEDLSAGGIYNVSKHGFLKEVDNVIKLDCPSVIYQCKTESSGERPGGVTYTSATYEIYATEEEKKKNQACMKDITDIKEDINEETAFQKGMTLDEWLEETEGPTAEECKNDPTKEGCAKNSCEVIDTSGEVFKILKQILGYLQIGSVFVVLILSVLDLGGAIASSNDDAFRKARGKVMKRIIALILIFLVPLLINFVINLVNLGACSEEDYDFIGNLFH